RAVDPEQGFDVEARVESERQGRLAERALEVGLRRPRAFLIEPADDVREAQALAQPGLLERAAGDRAAAGFLVVLGLPPAFQIVDEPGDDGDHPLTSARRRNRTRVSGEAKRRSIALTAAAHWFRVRTSASFSTISGWKVRSRQRSQRSSGESW